MGEVKVDPATGVSRERWFMRSLKFRKNSSNRRSLLTLSHASGYMSIVGKVLKILVMLLVVIAVTTILLTPSPSDDVPGVMHRNHTPVALAIAVGLIQIALSVKSSHLRENISSHILLPSNFLEVLCQHLC